MTENSHDGHLGDAYGATAPDQIAQVYDRWSETYDAEMMASGYRHPTICLALLTRHLAPGPGPILDAGAGTGLIGEWLRLLGYERLEALDISAGMLAIAQKKEVYAAFHKAALGGPLPFESDSFAGIVSAGVFTTGHVGAEGLDELIRACRPGGVIVVTVKNALWPDMQARLGALAQSGALAPLEETEPYVSMPGERGTEPSRALALKVLC